MPCRVQTRRIWTGRLILEQTQHAQSGVFTLTFADAFCPKELSPKILEQFNDRLRRELPWKYRFFGCGEYGDQGGRPHVHVILFGVDWYYHKEYVEKVWTQPWTKVPYGHVHSMELNHDTAQYVCGYVTKKWTQKDHRDLKGRAPEFARMSRGLGGDAVKIIGDRLMLKNESIALVKNGDVPFEMRVNGKKYPIGRWLRRKLRTEIGWNPECPQAVLQARAAEYRSMTEEDKKAREVKREARYQSALSRAKIASSRKKL